LGSYNTAGGISATISPLLLGIVAASVSLPAVFVVVGVLIIGGAVALLILTHMAAQELGEQARQAATPV
jgi:hypothetical protein